jgi:hypothetical protein
VFLLSAVLPPLRGVVRRLAAYDECSGPPVRRRQAPTGACTLVLGLGEPLRVDDRRLGSFLGGLSDGVAVTEFRGHQAGVQVDLAPLGLMRLLGAPGQEVGGAPVATEDLAAVSPAGRTLAALTGRLAAQVGLAPTTTARVLRFRRAADLLVPGPGEPVGRPRRIADVAQDCGYADHAHLDREFRALAGCSPQDYVAGWAAAGVDPAEVVRH